MFDRAAIADRVANMLVRSRMDAGLSQQQIAKALGKSVKTISNWEKGYGAPDAVTQMEWFDVCGLNELPYLLAKNYPETYADLSVKSDFKDIKAGVIKYLQEIASEQEIRQLSFCMMGNTGSAWSQQLNMLTAYNHCPMSNRVVISQMILDNYTINKIQGNLVCPDNIQPDMASLKKATDQGRDAISNGHEGYAFTGK